MLSRVAHAPTIAMKPAAMDRQWSAVRNVSTGVLLSGEYGGECFSRRAKTRRPSGAVHGGHLRQESLCRMVSKGNALTRFSAMMRFLFSALVSESQERAASRRLTTADTGARLNTIYS